MSTLTPDILAHIVTLHLPFGALNGVLRTNRLFANAPIDRDAYIATTTTQHEDETITINAYPNGYRLSACIRRNCDIELTYKDGVLETFYHTYHRVMGYVSGAWWIEGRASKHCFQAFDGKWSHSVTVDVVSGKRKYSGKRTDTDVIEATMQLILDHARAGRRADACAVMAEQFGRDANIADTIAGFPVELQ